MSDSPPSPRRRHVANVLAGISVAMVLVPQSMAYAELAGMPPHLGLYASALPPIVGALLASSPWLQTGPTALTSLLVFGGLAPLAKPGSDEWVGLAILLAFMVGLARVVLGILRAGALTKLLTPPVLRGFTVAAAVLILTSQLPGALGVAPPTEGVLPRAAWTLAHPGEWALGAIAYAAVTLVAIFGGRRVHMLFPGVLLAVVVATAVSAITGYAGFTVGEVPSGFALPDFNLPWERTPELLIAGLTIAVVGYAEPASIAQTLADREKVPWDANKEFIAQGAASLASAASGSFAVGGSFSRTALNHLAGSTSRVSGGITGLTVLCFLPVAFVLGPLPRAVLSAIVIAAVVSLLRPRPIVEIWERSRLEFLVGLVTFGVTIGMAPRIEIGVLIGVAFAIVMKRWLPEGPVAAGADERDEPNERVLPGEPDEPFPVD